MSNSLPREHNYYLLLIFKTKFNNSCIRDIYNIPSDDLISFSTRWAFDAISTNMFRLNGEHSDPSI